MAWRNIEIDHLIIGYLLTQDDHHASDQPLPTVSGASHQRMLADTKASEHPHTSAVDAARTRTRRWRRRTDRNTATGLTPTPGERDEETDLIGPRHST
jgi:hypothetical protein